MFGLREIGGIYLAVILGLAVVVRTAHALLRWFGFSRPWWYAVALVIAGAILMGVTGAIAARIRRDRNRRPTPTR
jgi:hypothetical protein